MSPLWIASRATGLVSFVLLTLVLVLGISVRRMAGSSRTPRFVWVGLHRNATLLATVLVGLHVLTVVTDSYVDVRWTDVVLPFVGHYRPFWLGLGTVSLDLMAVLTVTSLLRDRISRRLWRGLHWTAYLFWPIAAVHAIGIGTDMRGFPGLALVAACGLVVTGAGLWRLSGGRVHAPHLRAAHHLNELRDAGTRARVRATTR